MEDTRAARRYALALFELAQEKQIVSRVEEDLTQFSDVLENNAEFRRFYNAPNLSAQLKISAVTEIFGGQASPLALNLYKLMITKGRGREVPAVKKEFTRIRQEVSGVVFATVTSSVSLSDLERRALVAKLEAMLGKQVEAQYLVDSGILGGVKVVYGNNSIDASVKGALDHLKQQLHHDVLKQA